jgi:hypothetical protein
VLLPKVAISRCFFQCKNNDSWKVEGSTIPDEVFFLIFLILSAAFGPGVYSASNRNEYEKHKNNNVSGE